MALLVSSLVTSGVQADVSGDVLVEIAKLQFASQQENAKNFAAFLSLLGEKHPNVVNTRLAQLIKHVDCEV